MAGCMQRAVLGHEYLDAPRMHAGEGSLYVDRNQRSLRMFNVYSISGNRRTRQTMQSLSHPRLRSILVNAFPPPRELSKKPHVMLLRGRPEVKTHKYFTCPTGEGKKKGHYTCLVCCVHKKQRGGRKEAGPTGGLCAQKITPAKDR